MAYNTKIVHQEVPKKWWHFVSSVMNFYPLYSAKRVDYYSYYPGLK